MLLTLLAPLAACGGSGNDNPTVSLPSAGQGSTSAPTSAASATVSSSATPLPTSTATVSASPPASATALLTDVAVGAHDGFTRVVFTFSNQVPGYVAGYAQPPFQQSGSGRTVEVKGDAFVKVRMERAATADLSAASAQPTYTGPSHVPGTGVVSEVTKTGDFEAVMTWVIGLQGNTRSGCSPWTRRRGWWSTWPPAASGAQAGSAATAPGAGPL